MSFTPLDQNKVGNIIQPENFEITRNIPIDTRYIIDSLSTLDRDIPYNRRYPGLMFYAINEPSVKNFSQYNDNLIDADKRFHHLDSVLGDLFIFENNLNKPVRFINTIERYNKKVLYLTADFLCDFDIEKTESNREKIHQRVKNYFDLFFTKHSIRPGQILYLPQICGLMIYLGGSNYKSNFLDCFEWITHDFYLHDISDYTSLTLEVISSSDYWPQAPSRDDTKLIKGDIIPNCISLDYILSNTKNVRNTLFAYKITNVGNERRKSFVGCKVYKTFRGGLEPKNYLPSGTNSIYELNRIYNVNGSLYISTDGLTLERFDNIRFNLTTNIKTGLNKIEIPEKYRNIDKLILDISIHINPLNNIHIFSTNNKIIVEDYVITSDKRYIEFQSFIDINQAEIFIQIKN